MPYLASILHSWLRPWTLPRHRRPAPGRARLKAEELEPRLLLSSYHFDFGPSGSPVAKGYVGVPSVAYSSIRGYGWATLTGLSTVTTGIGNALETDFATAHDDTFKVNLPNGTYDIQPTLGDALAEHANIDLFAQGQQIASGLTTLAGQWLQPAYRIRVSNGQLDLRLRDNGGPYPYYALDGLDINPAAAPTANAGPNQTTTEGTAVPFNGSASGSSFLSYLWNFGDGFTASGTLTPTHTYADDGTYTVTLTVTDSLGHTAQSTAIVTVKPVAPTVTTGSGYAGTLGSPIQFLATATDPSSVDTAAGFTYTWNFGDGSTDTGPAPAHAYAATGIYDVTVTVTDADGYSSSATTSAAVRPSTVFLATTGVYAVGPMGAPIPQAVLSDPNVDGIALRATWDQIETADGVYDWTYLDTQIGAAANAGKKVALGIAAGTATPAWVYAEGASPFQYIDDTSPQTQTIPVPWDPVFLAKWEAFVGALGNRYASNPAVVRVDISGINTTTLETKLPRSQGAVVSNALGTWTTTNDVANWLSLGYTGQRVESAWQGIADTFSQAFPRTQLDIRIITSGTPPIDDAGNVIPGASADPQLVADLINTGIARYGAQFIVQNNGLSDTYLNSQVSAVANQVTTGYQMLWYVTNDPTYRMNNGVPINIVTELQTAIDKAIAANAKYLEIYYVDIKNPALQAVIADAHTRLLSSVPTATITGVPSSGHLPEGTTLTLGSMVADPTSASPTGLVYAWSVTKNGVAYASGSGPGFSFTPDDSGIYIVSLTLTDLNGRTSLVNSITITADDVAPTASVGGPYTGAAGSPIAFAASATDPSPVDSAAGFTYLWNFGDGTTGSGQTPDHTYALPGIYTAILTVIDTDGETTTVTTKVTVS